MATPKPLTLAPIATPAPSRLARLALARLVLAPKPSATIGATLAPLTIDKPNLFHKFIRQFGDNPEVMQGWLEASNPRKYIFGKLTETLTPKPLTPLENSILETIGELSATIAETLTPETIGNP